MLISSTGGFAPPDRRRRSRTPRPAPLGRARPRPPRHPRHRLIRGPSRRPRFCQPVVEQPASTRNPRHHRADRHVEHPRDVGVRKLLDVPQPDRLAEIIRELVERGLQIRIECRPGQQLLGRLVLAGPVDRLFHRFAVHVHRIAHVVPPHVPERVVEDREEPRFEVRAALELRGRTKGLQVGLLHEILGILRAPRQPERGAVQAVDVGERFGGENVFVDRLGSASPRCRLGSASPTCRLGSGSPW